MDLETVRTETKTIVIYIVPQRFRDDLQWRRRRTGRYGRMVLQNVIDMNEQNKAELKYMMERLNCTTATSVECFASILKKMFADKRYNWRRVLTTYAFTLALAV